MLDLPRVPPQDEKARRAADRRRLLGDEPRREIEVELRDVHRLRAYPTGRALAHSADVYDTVKDQRGTACCDHIDRLKPVGELLGK
jgi:hypothetical protein